MNEKKNKRKAMVEEREKVRFTLQIALRSKEERLSEETREKSLIKVEEKAKVLEDNIYLLTEKLQKEWDEEILDVYKKVSFEILGHLLCHLPFSEAFDFLQKEIDSDPGKPGTYIWRSNGYESMKEKANRRRLFQVELNMGGIAASATPCKYCGKKTVTYKLLQTRSADEGTTVFYKCVSCGERWKD